MEVRYCSCCEKEKSTDDFYNHKGRTYLYCKRCTKFNRNLAKKLKSENKRKCFDCNKIGPIENFIKRKCITCFYENRDKYHYKTQDHPWVRDEYLDGTIKIDGQRIRLITINRSQVSLLIKNGYFFIFKDRWWEEDHVNI